MQNENLAALRVQIDEVDRELVKLFQKRMQISEQVAGIKARESLALTDENREREVIAAAVDAVDDDYKDDTAAFMQGLIELSKSRQRRFL